MRHLLLATTICGSLAASPAFAAYNKGQELTILAVHAAMLAAQHCPYRLDEARVKGVLARKGLSATDVESGSFSPLLQEDMAADDQRYAGDTAAACDQAWASYGPEGPLKGLLVRR